MYRIKQSRFSWIVSFKMASEKKLHPYQILPTYKNIAHYGEMHVCNFLFVHANFEYFFCLALGIINTHPNVTKTDKESVASYQFCLNCAIGREN